MSDGFISAVHGVKGPQYCEDSREERSYYDIESENFSITHEFIGQQCLHYEQSRDRQVDGEPSHVLKPLSHLY